MLTLTVPCKARSGTRMSNSVKKLSNGSLEIQKVIRIFYSSGVMRHGISRNTHPSQSRTSPRLERLRSQILIKAFSACGSIGLPNGKKSTSGHWQSWEQDANV